jgi:pyridoxamine 5'-phosphate oxidase
MFSIDSAQVGEGRSAKLHPRVCCFTDKRTPKVAELSAQPVGMLTFWSKRLGWQCRIALSFQVHIDGPEVDAAWARMSQSAAAKDYLALVAPGSPIVGNDCDENTAANNTSHNLALLTGRISSIDWLESGQSSHRRIKFMPDVWQEVVA